MKLYVLWDRGDQPENIQGAGEWHAEYFIMLTVGTFFFLPYEILTGNWEVVKMVFCDCKYLQSQVFKVSHFVFDLSECYRSNRDPNLWELFLLHAELSF